MRIAHTGDLHIGKRLHEVSLLEDQKSMLENILNILQEKKVELLVIAGDIYDKPTPSGEAVKVFDEFISQLAKREIKLVAISGNHDSMERISYGSRVMCSQGIYFQENFSGKANKLVFQDDLGELNIYMVPFIKPVFVGKDSYEASFEHILKESEVDYSKRNILVAHQFVTPTPLGDYELVLTEEGMPERCDSETKSIGGLDNISWELFSQFDYVALGHLHRRQFVGKETIRYSGSPMKYSFSECHDIKSIEIVDIGKKGDVKIESVELPVVRDVRVVKGTMEQLTSKEVVFAEGVSNEDYICAIVTDEDRVTDGAERLLRWYPNLLTIMYERDIAEGQELTVANIKGKTPYELFEEYYEMVNGKPMSKAQSQVIHEILGGDMNEA